MAKNISKLENGRKYVDNSGLKDLSFDMSMIEIGKDKKFDGKDLSQARELYEQFEGEKKNELLETRKEFSLLLKDTLLKGYDINNENDYKLLELSLKIMGLNYLLPNYKELSDKYGNFSIKLEKNELKIYNLSYLKGVINLDGNINIKNISDTFFSSDRDFSLNNNELNLDNFEIKRDKNNSYEKSAVKVNKFNGESIDCKVIDYKKMEIDYGDEKKDDTKEKLKKEKNDIITKEESKIKTEDKVIEEKNKTSTTKIEEKPTKIEKIDENFNTKNCPIKLKHKWIMEHLQDKVENIYSPKKQEIINILKNFDTLERGVATIYALQIALSYLGYNEITTISGTYIYETKKAVKAFQKKEGLKNDGIPGKETIAKILEKLN